ncbi:S9 family peptidase [Porticoccaceae bacterium LTM1]|nr:S9 family peptidase [Porticoccaceae bacterium LTM1]
MKKLSVVLALAWTFILSPAAFADEKRDMTLNDIAKISYVTSVSTSPNGKWIAYTKSVQRTPYKDKDGRAWSELHISDTKGNSKPFITGEINISSVSWSADSNTIYYLAKRNDDKHPSLYGIPVDGGESTKIYSHVTPIGGYDISKDGKQLVILATDKDPKFKKDLAEKGFKAKVYEEELKFNKALLVDLTAENKVAVPLDTKGHVQQIAFNDNGSGFVAKVSKTPLIDDIYMASKVVVLDSAGQTVSELNVDGKVGHGYWMPNGKSVAYIGVDDVHNPKEGIVKFHSSAKSEAVDLQPGLMGHTMAMDILPKGDVLAVNHIGTGSEVVIIDPKKPGKSSKLKTGDKIVRAVSTPVEGRGFAFIADAPNHPREAFWYERGRMTRLTNSNPWLDDVKLARQESITWKAEDGTEIQGVLTYPLNFEKGKRYPLINFIHGGPEAHMSNGWNMRYSEPVHVAAAKGYFTLAPNYRGSTGRGVAFSKADQHAYADPEFRDIVAGKDYLVEKGMVDPKKVGITGGSYGGFATAWSATALSEHYQAAVMFVGISNQLSKFGTTDIPNEMHLVHARAWPWEDYNWMLERSPIFHAQKHRTPLLIMHGEEDTRVHTSQSLEMYRYLKTLDNAPVRLVLYPGEGHGNRKVGAQMDYSMRLMRWMDHFLVNGETEAPEHDLEHQNKLKKPKEEQQDSNGNHEAHGGDCCSAQL